MHSALFSSLLLQFLRQITDRKDIRLADMGLAESVQEETGVPYAERRPTEPHDRRKTVHLFGRYV